MCHRTTSRPPAAPVHGDVARHGDLTLTAADGAVSGAYHAFPATPNGRNVVILPDVRGLHPYYQDLARRFAEAGFGAVVIDWYGRTLGPGDRADDVDLLAHLRGVRPEEVELDVAAALRHLDAVNPGPVYSVGFCFGGGQSWRLVAGSLPLAGAIGFYGLPSLVTDVADRVSAPLLLLLAGDDVATPAEEFQALQHRLAAAGVPHETHVYEGAPHSFFDRAQDEWRAAGDDAWRRILDFTSRHGRAR